MQPLRLAILAEAGSWLRTPYHHEAMVKGAGVDCAMLLVAVYHACGLIPAIDPRPYPPDWMLHRSEERYLGWVRQYAHPVGSPLPGDIAVYQFGRVVAHAAIVVDWPRIIHAYRPAGMVILGDGAAGVLEHRLRGFWRLNQFREA